MVEINKLMVLSGGVQTRWKIESEAPLPSSFKSLNNVMKSRACDAWKAAGRLRLLVDIWSNFLALGMLRSRLDPDLAQQIRERFPELGDIDRLLEAVASSVQIPEEMRAELAEFDREYGLRREPGNAEGPSKTIKLGAQDFERLRRAVGKLLETEAVSLHRLDVSVEQFRRPWQELRQDVQGFIGIDEEWASEPPKIQQKVAERIRAGEDPKSVVAEHLPHKDGRHQKVGRAVDSLVRGLQQGVADLGDRLEKVGPAHVNKHLVTLQSAQGVIEHLLREAKKKTKSVLEMIADCMPTDEE
jgi:hypothetical protein